MSLKDALNKINNIADAKRAAEAAAQKEAGGNAAETPGEAVQQQEDKEAQEAREKHEAVESLKQELTTLLEERGNLLNLKQELGDLKGAEKQVANALNTYKTLRRGVRQEHTELKEGAKEFLENSDPESEDEEIRGIRQQVEKPTSEHVKESEEIADLKKEVAPARKKIRSARTAAKKSGLDFDIKEMTGPEASQKLKEGLQQVNEKLRAFVLEHADVDPERIAEVREALIEDEKNTLIEELNNTIGGGGLTSPVRNVFSERIHGADTRSFEKLDQDVLIDAFHAASRTISTEHALFARATRQVTGENPDDLDKEAVRRAMATYMVSANATSSPLFQPEALGAALAKELAEHSTRFGGEKADPELINTLRSAPQYGTPENKEWQQMVVREFVRWATARDNLMSDVGQTLESAKQLRFYDTAAEKLRENRERFKEASHLKDTTHGNELREIDHKRHNKKIGLESWSAKRHAALDLIRVVPIVRQDVGNLVDSPVRIYNGKVTVETGTTDYRKETEQNRLNHSTLKELIRQYDDAPRGVMGFGDKSKPILESLSRAMGEISGDATRAYSIDDARKKVEAIENRDMEIKREIENTSGRNNKVANSIQRLMENYQTAFGSEAYEGTVANLLETIQERARSLVEEAESNTETHRAELQTHDDREREIRDKNVSLERELRELKSAEEVLRRDYKAAEDDLLSKKIISDRRTLPTY